jgi:hypothetical protein
MPSWAYTSKTYRPTLLGHTVVKKALLKYIMAASVASLGFLQLENTAKLVLYFFGHPIFCYLAATYVAKV